MTRALSAPRAGRAGTVQRFAPRFWTCDVPPTSSATIVSQWDGFTVRARIRLDQDAVAAVWWGSLLADHPALRYDTGADLTGVTLAFTLHRSGDAKSLDNAAGPFLEVEVGRDRYVVPLWNYRADATVTNNTENAFSIPFDTLFAGPTLPADDDTAAQDYQRVPVTDVRCVRLVLPSADVVGTAGGGSALSPVDVATWTVSDLTVTGGGALPIEDRAFPSHRATAGALAEDLVKFSPEFVVERLTLLGFAGLDLGFGRGRLDDGTALTAAASAWLADLAERMDDADLALRLVVALERWAALAPSGWVQEDFDENEALNGGVQLLAPTVAAATDWLEDITLDALGDINGAGAALSLLILIPEWWCDLDDGRVPYIYDAATITAYGETPFEPFLETVDEDDIADHFDYLEWLAAEAATAASDLADAVATAFPAADVEIVSSGSGLFDESLVVAVLAGPAWSLGYLAGNRSILGGDAWAVVADGAAVALQHEEGAVLWSLPAMMADGIVFSGALPVSASAASGVLTRHRIEAA